MSHRYRIPNRSRMASSKIRAALRRIRTSLLDPRSSTLHDASRAIFNLLSKILPRVGKPSFDPLYLSMDGDPDPAAWNKNLDTIQEDLGTLFEEVEEVRQLRAEVSNAAGMASKELEAKANLAQSLLTDLRLVSGQLDQELIVATDHFLDTSKIDTDFPLQFPAAEINTMQGAVTLQRTNAINVITDRANVAVAPIGPEALVGRPDQGRLPTPDGTMRFYEGRFYAPLNEGRPEGGRWHLEERVRPGVVVSGDSIVYTMDNTGVDIFEDFPDLRREADARPHGFPLRPEDIIVLDRGASLVELQASRKRLVDGSPDSFFECEFVVDAPQLDTLANPRYTSSWNSVEGHTGSTFEENVITPQELRARAAREDIDRFDFEIEIMLRMDRRQTVNFITINPMNFDETAWLEVSDISTAETEDDAFVPIEGFDDQIFENVLTDEVNAELTEGEARTVLAPSQYAYRGQGVYSFSPREVSRVRIRLRQRTPVPSHYERIVIQLTRTLSATESSYEGSGCFPAGAMVRTPTGERPIEELRPGDEILSWDLQKNEYVTERVTRLLQHKPSKVYQIKFWCGHELKVNGYHSLLAPAGMRRVGSLARWDTLYSVERGHVRGHEIESITLSSIEPVFNLHTTGLHNFIVSGFVAHNFTFFAWVRTWWHRLFVDRKWRRDA